MTNLSILLIGDADRREFRQARDCLAALGHVWRAASAASAAAFLADAQAAADVIVVAQAHPGEFSHADIDRLRQLAPLARIVALLGSWCEGELRTGKPWPANVRICWHQWPARAEQKLQRLVAGRASAWTLPVTATEEERLLADAEEPLPAGRGLIAVSSRVFALADWLMAACGRSGYGTVWLRPPHRTDVERATAVIFDGSECRGEELDELRRVAAELAPAPLLALMDFPRSEDCDRARAAGAAAVLAKPLCLADLFWQLERVIGTAQQG
jgi:hypothetical protein